MKLDALKIVKILLAGSYITSDDYKTAEVEAQKSHQDLVQYLLNNELINKDLLGQAIAENFKVFYADLNSNIPSRDQVLKIPENIGRKNRLILFTDSKKEVIIATDDPENTTWLKDVAPFFPGQKVKIAYSLPEDIDNALVYYRKTLETRFATIIRGQDKIAPEIMDEILADATAYRASDIHLEPEEKDVVVRFRIDGVLQEAGRLPRDNYENIVNRIKVRSHLRTDEHYAAQDGSMRYFNSNGLLFDLRVSVVPTLDGEKVVIRVLAQYLTGFGLSDLGLSIKDQKIIEAAAQKPFGMILVVGPTGSGKTTTLYALLKKMNDPEINITTIEDPVEYKVQGINQIQVNPQTNLTFAKGLRSIVRQDPDIILVGEIRDTETAEISVNAALTGHLLLSTFHANDAATGIPRLLDMAVEPFLLASTLQVILAQRLARKICENCRVSQTLAREELLQKYPQIINYFPGESINLYHGKGCTVCNNTGYHGRTAIFELILITPELQDLILSRPSTKQIWDLARQQGSHSLFEDGIEKVKTGVTTIDEVMRVAEPPVVQKYDGEKQKTKNRAIRGSSG